LPRKNQRLTARNTPFEIRASAHDCSIERIEISLVATVTLRNDSLKREDSAIRAPEFGTRTRFRVAIAQPRGING
jgi:hypothetical protein